MISSTMNVAAASATLSLRKRRQKSCSGDRAATGALPATISIDAVVFSVQQIAGACSSTQILCPLGGWLRSPSSLNQGTTYTLRTRCPFE